MIALGATSCAALAIILGLVIGYERHSILRQSEAELQYLGQTLREYAANSFDVLDVVMRMAAARAVLDRTAEGNEPQTLRDDLADILDGMPNISAMGFLRQDGSKVAWVGDPDEAKLVLKYHDYFAVQQDQDAGTFVGMPIGGGTSRGVSFVVSRRVASADGAFDGIVWAVVQPAHFRGFYQTIATRSVRGFVLLSDSGAVIASAAGVQSPGSAAMPSAPVNVRSLLGPRDQRATMVSTYDLSRWPVSVVLFGNETVILAAWHKLCVELLVIGLVAVACIVLFCRYALRADARRQATVSRLEATEAQLRERVRDLEETRERLERQHEELTDMAAGYAAARDVANAATRAKSDFLANMSHELRTPLNAILGFSEVLREEMFGPLGHAKYLEYANDIFGSGSHLLELIGDVLDLSKIEAGKLNLQSEPVEPFSIVESVVRIAKSRADDAGITLETSVPADLPTISVDRRAMKQILINLLSNAIKFTPAGGSIKILGESELAGVRLTIIDTGIGIPPREIDRVMLPFEQGSNVTGGTYGGTGLGLPLVKALAHEHGGEFTLKSVLGAGTTASLYFPRQVAQLLAA